MSHTLKTRGLAMVAGLSCTFGAAYLLFGGMPSADDINAKTIVSGLTLVIAVAAMHQLGSAVKNAKFVEGFAMLTLALVATALVVVGTAGRNAETDRAKEEKTSDARAAHARAIVDLDKLRARRDLIVAGHEVAIADATATVKKYRDAIGTACTGGNGNACKGAKEALGAAQFDANRTRHSDSVKAALEALDASIGVGEANVRSLLPPADLSDSKAFAGLLATVGIVASADKAEAVINKLLPYAKAVVIEIAAVAFLLIAFPPVKVYDLEPVRVVREETKPAPALTVAKPVAITWQQSAALPAYSSAAMAATVALPALFATMPSPVAAAPATQATTVSGLPWSDGASHLLVTLADAGEAVTVGEAAELMGVTMGEASRRKDELVAAGKIEANREGRFVYLTLA